MPYEKLATSRTPALIIYLLDISASMSQPLGKKRRIDVVMDALQATVRQMVFRSTKGSRLSPRYRVAMLAYSDKVWDLLGGIQPIDQVARKGIPELVTHRATRTALAFSKAEELLRRDLPNLQYAPAPLICHMTDGEFTGEDPEPVVRRIMQISVPDGPVLVENIFISDRVLRKPVTNPREWLGILPNTPLSGKYAKKLRRMSSQLPESYRSMMVEMGYSLAKGALMLLPGTSPDLVAMGFQMSAATPVR